MKHCLLSINKVLQAIYSKHRTMYPENPDSKQLCCMWSTNDPPDIIEGTEPICAIEEALDVQISDDLALELYDMDIDQGSQKLLDVINERC